MNIILILKIVVFISIFCIVIFSVRSIISNRKVKRISFYSLEPLRDNNLSVSDKFINKFFDFIRKMRKIVNKSEILKKSSNRYDKFISYGNREKIETIDFISIKIIIALFFLILTGFSQIFTMKIFGFYDYVINFFIGYYLFDMYLYFYQKKQGKLISNELLRAIIIMNNAFKSGKSTLQALDIASKSLPLPISDEFKKMYLDMKFGLSIDSVFDRFSKRVDLMEATYISSSLKILNKTGGNIVEVFSSIERTLFDKKKLNEELKNISSSPNMIVKILLFVPIIFVLFIYILDPTYFSPLFNSPLGYIIIGIIVIMFTIYALLLRRILKIEV